MNIYKLITYNLNLSPQGKLVLIYLLGIGKKEIEAQIKYIGANICGFKEDNVYRQMNKIINELTEKGYIDTNTDYITIKNTKVTTTKRKLTTKALRLIKDEEINKNHKPSLPTQVIDTPKVDITKKEKITATQPTLAELQAQIPI